MPKYFTIAVHILAAAMLLGNGLAPDTPAATTPKAPSSAAAGKAQTTAAKRPTGSKTAAPLALKTSKEKFSYPLGIKMGANLHKQSVLVDPNILARGLKDGLSGGKTLLIDEQEQAVIVEVQNDLSKNNQEKMQAEGATNKKEW